MGSKCSTEEGGESDRTSKALAAIKSRLRVYWKDVMLKCIYH
jgi:hypothetical protein